MPVFGCASNKQFELEKYDYTKLSAYDLKIFWGKYCLAMEQFIKSKGLFEEFQEKIKPKINFDSEVMNVNSTR